MTEPIRVKSSATLKSRLRQGGRPFETPTYGGTTHFNKWFRVPKGTLVRSMHPTTPRGAVPAGRALIVMSEPFTTWENPVGEVPPIEIVWPGTGGYWCHAKLADVEPVEVEITA